MITYKDHINGLSKHEINKYYKAYNKLTNTKSFPLTADELTKKQHRALYNKERRLANPTSNEEKKRIRFRSNLRRYAYQEHDKQYTTIQIACNKDIAKDRQHYYNTNKEAITGRYEQMQVDKAIQKEQRTPVNVIKA